MKMQDNTILITGGTSGIGLALALAFRARGNRVIIAGRRRRLLAGIAEDHPGIETIELDVADWQSIRDASARLKRDFPGLNVVFNNAGIMQPENLLARGADSDVWRQTITTNITGALHLNDEILPLLAGKPDAAIITTTSGLAFVPRGSFPAYSASKAFLHSWTQSLRHQLRHSGIEVLELAPPYVQTELTGAHQAVDPLAMPLADFTREVMALLEARDTPDGEILVERVRRQRYAERDGAHAQLFAALNPA